MSKRENILKFELFPNEILIQCFEYLNIFDIYHSFNELNNRFNKLIYSILLHLNFEYINKTIFDKFCTKILLNSQIKNQIYSLKLSNKLTCYQIEIFLSFFSLHEFSNLRSLTLIDINNNDGKKLELMLPLIPQLSYLHVIHSDFYSNPILINFFLPKLRTLSLSYTDTSFITICKTSSIINLTITVCHLIDFYQLIKQLSKLEYFNIKTLYCGESKAIEIYSNNQYALHLKKLIIGKLENISDNEFTTIKNILKQMPNLKSLTLTSSQCKFLIDAFQWEYLIKSLLPYLDIFMFKFCDSTINNVNTVVNKFKQFQSHFWQEEHHWYTEYVISDFLAYIYTIPYISNKYNAKLKDIRYSNNLINNVDTFNNVIDLMLSGYLSAANYQYYFSNVTSLMLRCENMTMKTIEYLKKIVNLFNLKHLCFNSYLENQNSLFLLELLKETPQLSSLSIHFEKLISFFNDNELCKYLNKMIKRLYIYDDSKETFSDMSKLKQFCEVFINIKHLQYKYYGNDDLLFLLKNLPKLSTMEITGAEYIYPTIKDGFRKFKHEAQRLNIIFRESSINHTIYYFEDKFNKFKMFIWIGKKQDLMIS